jgi:hypothetical protein
MRELDTSLDTILTALRDLEFISSELKSLEHRLTVMKELASTVNRIMGYTFIEPQTMLGPRAMELYLDRAYIHGDIKADFAIDRYQYLIERAEAFIAGLKREGVAIVDAEQAIKGAKEFVKHRELAQCDKALRDTIERVNNSRNKFIDGKLNAAVTELETIQSIFEKLNVKVETLDERLTDIKEFIDTKNHASALEMLNNIISLSHKLRDELITNKLNEVTVVIEKLVMQLETYGTDTNEIRSSIEDCRAKISGCDFGGAMKIVKRLEGTVKGEIYKRKRAVLIENISTLTSKLEDASARGVDVRRARNLLMSAKASLHRKDFELALKTTEACQQLLAELIDAHEKNVELLRKNAQEVIRFAKTLILEAEKVGANTIIPADIIRKAEAAFDAQRYAEAKEIARRAEKIATDLKDKAQYRVADEAIAACKSTITELKSYNINVKAMEKLVEDALHALNDRNYGKVDFLVTTINDECAKLKATHLELRAKSLIVELQEKLDSMKADGIKPSDELTKLWADAATYFKSYEYEAAIEASIKCREAIDAFIIQHKLAKYNERVAELKRDIDQLMDKGVENLEKVKQLFAALQNALKKEDFDTVDKLLADTRTELERARKAWEEAEAKKLKHKLEREKALDTLTATKTVITELGQLGIDTESFQRDLDGLVSAFDAEKFDIIISKGTKLIQSVEERKQAYYKESVEEKVNVMTQKLERAKALGVRIDKFSKQLATIENDIERHEYTRALTAIDKALGELEQKIEYQELVNKFKALRKSIHELNQLGVDVKPILSLMQTVKPLLRSRDLASARKIVIEVETTIADERQKYERAQAERELAKFEASLMDAEKRGVDIGSSKQLLIDAKSAFANADYNAVADKLKHADKCLKDAVEKYERELKKLKAKYTREVQVLKSIAAELQILGEDTTVLESAIRRVEDTIKTEKLDLIEKHVEEAKRIAIVAKKGYDTRKAKSTINSVETALNKLKNLGIPVDIGKLDRKLRLMRDAYGREDYRKVDTIGLQCNKDIEDIIRKNVHSIVSDVNAKMALAKEYKLDVTKISEKVHELSAINITSETIDKICSTAMDTVKSIDDTLHAYAKACITDIKKRIERMDIDDMQKRDLRIKISMIDDLLAKREYSLVLKQSDRLKGKLRELEREVVPEDLQKVGATIADLKKFIVLDDAEKRYKLAQAALEDKDYTLAQTYLFETKEHIENAKKCAYPLISVKIVTGKIQLGVWNKVELSIKNKGNADARQVEVNLAGPVSIQGIAPVKYLKAGDTVGIPIGLLAEKGGDIPLMMSIRCLRALDGQKWELEDVLWLKLKPPEVEVPPAIEARGIEYVDKHVIKPRKKIYKCHICLGTIKKMVDVINCECGKSFHESCATRVGTCPLCTRQFILPKVKVTSSARAPEMQQELRYCPICGERVWFVELYQQWYCYLCQRSV